MHTSGRKPKGEAGSGLQESSGGCIIRSALTATPAIDVPQVVTPGTGTATIDMPKVMTYTVGNMLAVTDYGEAEPGVTRAPRPGQPCSALTTTRWPMRRR